MAGYIERDSVFNMIGEHQKSFCPLRLWGRRFSNDKNAYDAWQVVLDEIDSVPAADVAPVVHGRWISWEEAGNFIPSPDRYECSVCHYAEQRLCNGDDMLSLYCPNCGAKMDKEASNGLEDS